MKKDCNVKGLRRFTQAKDVSTIIIREEDLAPQTRIQTLALFAIGVVLALPWLSDLRKTRAIRS